jgi:hypothetical protein
MPLLNMLADVSHECLSFLNECLCFLTSPPLALLADCHCFV